MKRFGHLAVLMVLVACFSPAMALVDIAGIIESGPVLLDVDSVIWYTVSSPAPILESTPGWSASAGTQDTFQFASKNEWPAWLDVYYRINGISSRFTINPLLPDTWYHLPAYDLQSTRIRFEDTVLVGIAEPQSPRHTQRIAITPNPVTGTILEITAPAGALRLEVYDLAGNLVLVDEWPDAASLPLRTDISRLQTGVYLARVISPAGRRTGQLVVLR